jgi:hypothetical protein
MSAALAWAGALMGGHRVSVGISESSSLYASKGADAAADAVDIHIECFAADDISSENDHGFLLPVTMRTAGGAHVDRLFVLSSTHLALKDLEAVRETSSETHYWALSTLVSAQQQECAVLITFASMPWTRQLTLTLPDFERAVIVRQKIAHAASFADPETLAELEQRVSALRFDPDAQCEAAAAAERKAKAAVKPAAAAFRKTFQTATREIASGESVSLMQQLEQLQQQHEAALARAAEAEAKVALAQERAAEAEVRATQAEQTAAALLNAERAARQEADPAEAAATTMPSEEVAILRSALATAEAVAANLVKDVHELRTQLEAEGIARQAAVARIVELTHSAATSQMEHEARLSGATTAGAAILRRVAQANLCRRCFMVLKANASEAMRQRTPPHPIYDGIATPLSSPMQWLKGVVGNDAVSGSRPRAPSTSLPATAHALDFSRIASAFSGMRSPSPAAAETGSDQAVADVADKVATDYASVLASAQAEALESQRVEMREVIALLAIHLEGIQQLHSLLLGRSAEEVIDEELGTFGLSWEVTPLEAAAANSDGADSGRPSLLASPPPSLYEPFEGPAEGGTADEAGGADEPAVGVVPPPPPPPGLPRELGDVDEADELVSPSSALDESEQLLQAQALLGARALAARLSERMALVGALHRRLEKSSLLQPRWEQAPTAESSRARTRAQTPSPPAPAKAKKERRPSALESAAFEQLQRSQYTKAGLAVQAYEGFDPAASTPRRVVAT